MTAMTLRTHGVRRHLRFVIVFALAASALTLGTGCAPGVRGGDALSLREITPAFLMSLEARDPALAADARGTVALAWVTRDSSRGDVWLAVSRDSGASFSTPARVNLAAGRVLSFPEGRPVVALGPGGALAVAWSERRADGTGAVDLRVRASADFGRTFGAVASVNDDAAGPPPSYKWRPRAWAREHRADAFHGFPALAFVTDGALLAAWLDDRKTPGPDAARRATLWHSLSSDGGQTWSANLAVSDSACPCCRPALASGADGRVALAYRDGSNDRRDPRIALSQDGGQGFPTDRPVSRDGWSLRGCPDQGPALVWDRAQGGQYAWFTGAAPAGVYVARWRHDGGVAGLRRPVADSLADAMHPVAVALAAGVLIGVESHAPEDASRHSFAVRVLDPDGTWSAWTRLGADATAGALAAGGARRAIACWIENEAGRARLRLAALTWRGGARG